MITEEQVKEMKIGEVYVLGESTLTKVNHDRYRVDNGVQLFVGSDIKQAIDLFNGII